MCVPPRVEAEGRDPEKLRVKWEGEVRKSIKDPERAEEVIALGVLLIKFATLDPNSLICFDQHP